MTRLKYFEPLTFAFLKNATSATLRQTRQLGYISQFTTNIVYLQGQYNVVADALSRIDIILLPTEISFEDFAEAQENDPDLAAQLKSTTTGLKITKIVVGAKNTQLYCDISGENLRIFVPVTLRERVFQLFHKLARPNAKVTWRIISKRYVWPFMTKDISNWAKMCLDGQLSKVSRHRVLLQATFVVPNSRFRHVHIDLVGPLSVSERFKSCLTMIDLWRLCVFVKYKIYFTIIKA